MHDRVTHDFFRIDALDIAPQLLGMQLIRRFDDGKILTLDISEIEVYRGEEDLACHAAKGRTQRTEIMYSEGGRIYVYLIYGMYWLLNITTGSLNNPQAILIRGTQQIDGPGRIGRALNLDKSFYGENLSTSNRLWLQRSLKPLGKIITSPRVGIDYAGEFWSNVPWRFMIEK